MGILSNSKHYGQSGCMAGQEETRSFREIAKPWNFTFKCDITNNSSEKILYLAVPIDLWFGNDKQTIKYRPIVSSLGIDQSFSFYVVNDCPVNVSAAWQDIPTKVTFLGESTPRNIILKRKYRNPAEQIMMFLESSVRWVGSSSATNACFVDCNL